MQGFLRRRMESLGNHWNSASPLPGLGLTFHKVSDEQGIWLNGIIVGDTGSSV